MGKDYFGVLLIYFTCQYKCIRVFTQGYNVSTKYTSKYLHIAGLFPVTPRDSPKGQMGLGVIPVVELALERVNSHPRILPGIKLHITWSDTKVSLSNKGKACNSYKRIFDTFLAGGGDTYS